MGHGEMVDMHSQPSGWDQVGQNLAPLLCWGGKQGAGRTVGPL